jgi:hypothetical protein
MNRDLNGRFPQPSRPARRLIIVPEPRRTHARWIRAAFAGRALVQQVRMLVRLVIVILGRPLRLTCKTECPICGGPMTEQWAEATYTCIESGEVMRCFELEDLARA